MPFSLLNLKQIVRAELWPQGEARSLRAGHDRAIVDALVSIQSAVECFQYDNTRVVQQCETYFRCGLTVFDAPRGMIKRLEVIDKLNATTGREDADAADNFCAAIPYFRVDASHMVNWLAAHRRHACCTNLAQYFAIPSELCGGKNRVPVPTGEGLPAGLPLLRLGYNYPQESTNATSRARYGVWAIERGRIYIAPWLNTTESALLYWDGIKREWADADQLLNDPKLIEAVKFYVEKEHLRRYTQDRAGAAESERQFNLKIAEMIYDCREETRVRIVEQSNARASAAAVTLYYNDAAQYTATCPAGQTGDSKTFTVLADTISSAVSKADANQKAQIEAREQAEALLVCETAGPTFSNTAQTYTATCTSTTGAPAPDGTPVTVTIPAGAHTASTQAAADAAALAAATEQALAQLVCNYWNAEQSFTADCDVTKTTPAHTYVSTLSQADADARALNAAKVEAETECEGAFESTVRIAVVNRYCLTNFPTLGANCQIVVTVTAAAGYTTSLVSQLDANTKAYNAALASAQQTALVRCAQHHCGAYQYQLL